MTLSLTHPLTGQTAASTAAVEAAHDSMAYWQKVLVAKQPKAEAAPCASTAALEQMFGYYA